MSLIDFYAGSGSPYAWRVWLALEHKALPYDLKMMSFDGGDLKKPEFLALNPPSAAGRARRDQRETRRVDAPRRSPSVFCKDLSAALEADVDLRDEIIVVMPAKAGIQLCV